MNAIPNFGEWTREQKEEYSNQRMLEMRLKNAKLMQRHAEVEQDRIQAEEHNSAVTNIVKVISKREKATSDSDSNKKEVIKHGREWDLGKPDKEYWTSFEHHDSVGSYKESQFADGKRDRYICSNNESSDRTLRNRSMMQYSGSKKLNFNSHPNANNFKEIQCISQKTYPLEMSKRIDSKHGPRPPSKFSTTNSDYIEKTMVSEKLFLRHNDKDSEDRNRKDRVENWVKSANKSNYSTMTVNSSKQRGKNTNQSYSKFDGKKYASAIVSNSNSSSSICNPSIDNSRIVPQYKSDRGVVKANQNWVTNEPSKAEIKGASIEAEGLWGVAEQPDIVWKLSDDETIPPSSASNDNW